MAGKGVTIDLLGNSSSIRAEIAKTRSAINDLDATVKSSSATQVTETEKVEKAHSGLAKSIAGIGAAYLGTETIFKGIDWVKDGIDLARQGAASNKALETTINSSGITSAKTAALIGRQVDQLSTKHGFLKDEVEKAYGVMLTATNSQSKSFTGLNYAMDLSRKTGKDLQTTTLLVAKAYEGNVTSLKRLGIVTTPVTTESDKLKASLKDQELALKAVTEAGEKHSKGTIDLTDAQQKLVPLGKLGIENLINETKAQQDAAKAADKRATALKAVAVIQQVAAGQAGAYDKTGAGIASRYGVQKEDIQREVGAAISPAVTDTERYLTNLAIAQQKPNSAFKQGLADVRAYSQQLAPDIKQGTDGAEQLWSRFGNDIKTGTRATFASVGSVAKTELKGFGQILGAAGDAASGDWKGSLNKIGGFTETQLLLIPHAANAILKTFGVSMGKVADEGVADFESGMKALPPVLETALSDAIAEIPALADAAGKEGEALGESIVSGILSGLGGLASGLEHDVSGAVSSALSAANPFSGGSGGSGGKYKGSTKTPRGATGMYIGGRYGADDVHIQVTGDEAVVNPTQRAMIDSGRYTVLGALAATGAPTIKRGGSYAGGAIPADVQLQRKIATLQALLTSEQKHLDPLSLQITQKDQAAKSGKSHLAPAKDKALRALKVTLQRRETAQRDQLSDMQQRFSILTSAAPGAAAFNTKVHPLEAAYARAQQRGTSTVAPLASLTKVYQARISYLRQQLKGNHSKVVNDQIQQELTSDYGQLQTYQTPPEAAAAFDPSSLVFLSAEHQYALDKALQLDANGNPVDPATAGSILADELANMQRGEQIAVASGNYATADFIAQQESGVQSQIAQLNQPAPATTADVSADTQAQLDQANARILTLTRGQGYDAAFGNAISQPGLGSGLGLMTILGDSQSIRQVASVAAKGFNAQPFVVQNSGSINV